MKPPRPPRDLPTPAPIVPLRPGSMNVQGWSKRRVCCTWASERLPSATRQRDAVPVGLQRQRDCPANARARAGNDGNLVGQRHGVDEVLLEQIEDYYDYTQWVAEEIMPAVR